MVDYDGERTLEAFEKFLKGEDSEVSHCEPVLAVAELYLIINFTNNNK